MLTWWSPNSTLPIRAYELLNLTAHPSSPLVQQGQPLGPAMLVFGCRSTEKDFICELLCLSPAVPSGCLTQQGLGALLPDLHTQS